MPGYHHHCWGIESFWLMPALFFYACNIITLTTYQCHIVFFSYNSQVKGGNSRRRNRNKEMEDKVLSLNKI